MKNSRSANPQSGNALFLILIAVALFAALSFVIVNSTRSNSGSVSRENARLLASEIMNYAVGITTTVSRLNVGGCTTEQISFEAPPFDGSDSDHVNPVAPDDFRCHVFHREGGAVPYKTPPVETQISNGALQKFYFTGANQVLGVGLDSQGTANADSRELLLVMPFVGLETCRELNAVLKKENDVPPEHAGTFDLTGWQGNWASAGNQDLIDAGNILFRQFTGCFHAATVTGPAGAGDGYYFYHVLMAR